jgi:hypothetical protein
MTSRGRAYRTQHQPVLWLENFTLRIRKSESIPARKKLHWLRAGILPPRLWNTADGITFHAEHAPKPLISKSVFWDAFHRIVFCVFPNDQAKSLSQFLQSLINFASHAEVEETRQSNVAVNEVWVKFLCQCSSETPMTGQGNGHLVVFSQRRGNGGHVNWPDLQSMSRQRTTQCFPSNMIPARTRLTVCEYG